MAIDDFSASNKAAFSIDLLTTDHRSKPEVASAKERSWFDQDAVYMPKDLSLSSAALGVVVAQSWGAKVIGLANAGTDTANAIKQATGFSVTSKQALAAALMLITYAYSLGLGKAQGMYLIEDFFSDLHEQTRAPSKHFFCD
jgi:hypothetical protein